MSRTLLLLALALTWACAPDDPDRAPADPQPEAEPEAGPNALYAGPCTVESATDFVTRPPVDEADGSYAYVLDANGDLVTQIYKTAGLIYDWETHWTRDAQGRVLEIRTQAWEDGSITTFEYDGDVKRRELYVRTGLHTARTERTWDTAGRPLTWVESAYEAPIRDTTWTYEGPRQLSREERIWNSDAPGVLSWHWRYTFTHDAADRISGWTQLDVEADAVVEIVEIDRPDPATVITRFMTPEGAVHRTQTETYDADQRLVARDVRDGEGALVQAARWTFDALGRLVEETERNGADELVTENSWTFDDDGNLVEERRGALAWLRTWDAFGNLLEVVIEEAGVEVQRRTFGYACFTDPAIDPGTWLDDFESL